MLHYRFRYWFAMREPDENALKEVVARVEDLGAEEKHEEAWEAAGRLRNLLQKHDSVSEWLCHLIKVGAFTVERNIELAEQIVESHPHSVRILSALGDAFQSFRDMRYLNEAPPDHPFLTAFGERLRELSNPSFPL